MANEQDTDAELRVPRREAAARLERQIEQGEALRRKEHNTENRTNLILEAIAEWHELNYDVLRDIFDRRSVAEDYREKTAGPSNLAFHSWNGKIQEADDMLFKRLQHVKLIYLVYRIAEKTGGPFEGERPSQPADAPQEAMSPQSFGKREVENALASIDVALAASYRQVCADLADEHRSSWAGAAHEIREMLATVLRRLAPDDLVLAQEGYKQEANTSGPTQRQRVNYILAQSNRGSKERDVIELAASADGMIGDVVRAMYGRASDAAHRFKHRKEVARLLNYFDAFAHDLLDI